MPLYEEKFICPFSIRFSQARIRPNFQDGREVEDSKEQIEAVEAPTGSLSGRYDLLLRAPFPPIEIIRWWPKLREEDGETLLDENGKTILGEPCWFTFDNRRLYCLQAAAAKHWPQRVGAVVHIMHDLPVSKCAPKKFRTTDLGCSVRISRRYDVVPVNTWSWMEATQENEADAQEAMSAVDLDANKEHWSELLDVPPDFINSSSSYSTEEVWRYQGNEEEDDDGVVHVNTRTARRLLKAGGSRVSRGGTESYAAANVVAAAASAAAKASSGAIPKRSAGSKDSSQSQRGSAAAAAAAPAADAATSSSSSSGPAAAAAAQAAAAAALPLELRSLLAGNEQGLEYLAAAAAATSASAVPSHGDLAAMYMAAAGAAGGYDGSAAALTWQFQQQMLQMQMQQQQFAVTAMRQQMLQQQQRAARQRQLQQQQLQKQQAQQMKDQKEQQARARKAAEALLRSGRLGANSMASAMGPQAAASAATAKGGAGQTGSLLEVGSTLLAAAGGSAQADRLNGRQAVSRGVTPSNASAATAASAAGASPPSPGSSSSAFTGLSRPGGGEGGGGGGASAGDDDDEDNCTQQ
eukprot:TRINITY_DN8876_c0_g1_i1.p1 TRINITY_DN8876_c0_g1~~TRINITY_DN8876_c0_g1_i1.p1  ORF type:complete len:579 (-),score=167.35 TRINITY_DN8876_c0_g1_i1:127-1863(-)